MFFGSVLQRAIDQHRVARRTEPSRPRARLEPTKAKLGATRWNPDTGDTAASDRQHATDTVDRGAERRAGSRARNSALRSSELSRWSATTARW